MRRLSLNSLLVLAALVWPLAARAGVEIYQTRLGFPAGGEKTHFKTGTWVPLYVKLGTDEDRLPPGCKLVIEAVDSDDLPGQYIQDLPEITAHAQEDILTYTRLGNAAGDMALTVLGPDGKTLASGKVRRDYQDALTASTPLVLVLGSTLPDLTQALAPPADKPVGAWRRGGLPGQCAAKCPRAGSAIRVSTCSFSPQARRNSSRDCSATPRVGSKL